MRTTVFLLQHIEPGGKSSIIDENLEDVHKDNINFRIYAFAGLFNSPQFCQYICIDVLSGFQPCAYCARIIITLFRFLLHYHGNYGMNHLGTHFPSSHGILSYLINSYGIESIEKLGVTRLCLNPHLRLPYYHLMV